MKAVPAGVAAIGILMAGSAEAHHSGVMYDAQKTVNLNGVVRVFQWTNPHSWVQIVVPTANGKTEEWSVELAATGVLTHRGWKPSTIKSGDKVSIVVHPMKDGTLAGNFVTATLADGTVISTGNGSGGGGAAQAQ
jgi:hypothetical protein